MCRTLLFKARMACEIAKARSWSRALRFCLSALIAALTFMLQTAAAGALSHVSVVPDDAAPGAATNYTFTYTLEQDVNADEALFYVNFPPGFDVATGACDRIASITLNPVPMGGTAICRGSYGSGNTVGFAVNTSIGGGVSVSGGTEVEVVVSGVTNPLVSQNYEFGQASGTAIMTTQMMDPMFPMVMEKDIAPVQTVFIGNATVNGACGTASGGVFASAPTGQLCSAGVASVINTSASTYGWTCSGTGGGSTASCSATVGYPLILSVSPISTGAVTCSQNPVPFGGSATCTATSVSGYSFSHWSGDCAGVGNTCQLDNVSSAKILKPISSHLRSQTIWRRELMVRHTTNHWPP